MKIILLTNLKVLIYILLYLVQYWCIEQPHYHFHGTFGLPNFPTKSVSI